MRGKAPVRSLWLVYLVADVAAITAAYMATLYFRFYSERGLVVYGYLMRLLGVEEPVRLNAQAQLFYIESAVRIVLILSATICFLYGILNLYAGRRFLLRRPVAVHVILANVMALGLYYCYFYARVNVFHPRTLFVTVAFFNIVFCVLLRGMLDRFMQFARTRFGFDESPHCVRR